MKYAALSFVPLLAQHTFAFPGALSEALMQGFEAEKREAITDCPFAKRAAKRDAEPGCPFSKRQAPGVTPPFDPTVQYVSTTGEHAFQAPGSGDLRGPCPGLNAMANHGYLPHNGIGDMEDFINGCQEAFGMGTDLATFLAIYGAVFDGDLTSYSIGGPPPPSLVSSVGLLGIPEGLSGSHNKYEGDVSPIRGDLFEYGNDYLSQLSQFTALYELGQQNGDSVDLAVLTEYRNTRFHESINNNPYFFNAPFSGIVASPAAWSFIYRFMANKSAEYPEGLLNGEVLKTFYSITGDYPDFTYTPGNEKFPDNWYKRNPVDYYTIPYFALDAIAMALQYPEFATLGGNTGGTNTFVGIDPQNLTMGVYNADNLLKGNNALCYGIELSFMEAPDILSGLYSDKDAALDKLGTAVQQATQALGCPQLNNINKGQFDQYPGYTKLKSDGTY